MRLSRRIQEVVPRAGIGAARPSVPNDEVTGGMEDTHQTARAREMLPSMLDRIGAVLVAGLARLQGAVGRPWWDNVITLRRGTSPPRDGDGCF